MRRRPLGNDSHPICFTTAMPNSSVSAARLLPLGHHQPVEVIRHIMALRSPGQSMQPLPRPPAACKDTVDGQILIQVFPSKRLAASFDRNACEGGGAGVSQPGELVGREANTSPIGEFDPNETVRVPSLDGAGDLRGPRITRSTHAASSGIRTDAPQQRLRVRPVRGSACRHYKLTPPDSLGKVLGESSCRTGRTMPLPTAKPKPSEGTIEREAAGETAAGATDRDRTDVLGCLTDLQNAQNKVDPERTDDFPAASGGPN